MTSAEEALGDGAWAAYAGLADNKVLPVEDRLGAALRSIALLEKQLEKARAAQVTTNVEIGDETPSAWRDLIMGLILLSKGESNSVSPTHCEHDELRVMANPHKFTWAEIIKLESLGFIAEGHSTSDREEDDEGSLATCGDKYCEATFYSFRYGSA